MINNWENFWQYPRQKKYIQQKTMINPWQYPGRKKYSARNNWKVFTLMRNGPPDYDCTHPWFT